MRGLLVGLVLCAACGDARRADEPALRVWHTFGPEETEALNEALGGKRVAATVIPFGRAQNRLRDVLGRDAPECPDLARIDATWLPGLAQAGLLARAPDGAPWNDLLAEATELAEWNGARWGVPQSIDGLALIYDRRRLAPLEAAMREGSVPFPPRDLDGLERLARFLAGQARFGVSVRADGYWFVAFLRAAGGDVWNPSTGELGVDRAEAERALSRYVALPAPPPEPAGDEAAREARRFTAGEVLVIVGGPWTVTGLVRAGAGEADLAVAPYPRAPDGRAAAPRGGQLWVVPRCSRRADEAWALAVELTAPGRQAEWSRRFGVIPTRTSALADASPLARAFAEALRATRPLPRHPLTPELFDDLTPAVQAALLGDATPEEALAGVARGWRRLLARGGAP